jgi:hypothetical protein
MYLSRNKDKGFGKRMLVECLTHCDEYAKFSKEELRAMHFN